MNIIEDYVNWAATKKDLIDKMNLAESLILQRLNPVLTVLDHLSKQSDLDEQEFYIFDIGYLYLSDQIQTIERYLEMMTFERLDESSVLYNYLMETVDFYEDAVVDKDIKDALEEALELLEELFLSRQPLDDELYQDIEDLKATVKEDYFSVVEIFSEIANEYEL